MKPSMGAMETLFIEKALDSIKNKKYPGLLESKFYVIMLLQNMLEIPGHMGEKNPSVICGKLDSVAYCML